MSTPLTELRPFLRAILGDCAVYGAYAYEDATLDSAVKAVFAANRAPGGYTLSGGSGSAIALLSSATGISPTLASGDDLALILNQACLLLVTGEDGTMTLRTRSLTIADGGDRKRDLLADLRERVYQIENGGACFDTQQSVKQWLIATGGSDIGELFATYTKADVQSLGGTISV